MEPLLDPDNDRAMKDIVPPPHRPISDEVLYPTKNTNAPNWEALKNHMYREGRVSKEHCQRILRDTLAMIKKEPNLLSLHDPVTVVGDIHGQYYDFVKMLDVGGSPAKTKYLFLGDYVDRGSFSCEVVMLLYALKLNFPQTIYMLRGNHECRQMTQFFNFRAECLYKYDQETYELFMETFDALPISCLVNDKFLALHGGISPELKTINDLKNLQRFQEPPRVGLFCDILWSDPVEDEKGQCPQRFQQNDVRGCSYFFGQQATNQFLQKNKLLSILRAHEAQFDGYKMHKWNGASEFPVVITIFSAPNYCDVYNNKGAIIKFEQNTLNIQQFNYTAHPYILPNFMDIFTWSVPFVAEKVVEMLFNVLKQGQELPDEEEEQVDPKKLIEQESTPKSSKADLLRNKVRAMSKMMKMFKILREENESVMQLKGICPDGKVPKGLLLEGKKAIENELTDRSKVFTNAKKLDSHNEGMPFSTQGQTGSSGNTLGGNLNQ
eukprot:403367261